MDSLISSGAFVELGETANIKYKYFVWLNDGTKIESGWEWTDLSAAQTAATDKAKLTANVKAISLYKLENGTLGSAGSLAVPKYTPASGTPEWFAQATKDRRFYYELYNASGEQIYRYVPLDITTYAACLSAAQAKAATMSNATTAKLWSTDGGGETGSTGKSVSVKGAAVSTPFSFTVDDATTGKRYYSSGGFADSAASENTAKAKAEAVAAQYGASMKYNLLQNGKIIGGNTVAAKTVTLTETLADGAVVKAPNDATIYIIEGGSKRPVSSMEAFNYYGYKMSALKTIPNSILDTYPTGTLITAPTAQPVVPSPPPASTVTVPITTTTQTPVTSNLKDTSYVTESEPALSLDNQYVQVGIVAVVGVGVIGTLYAIFGRRK